MQHVDALSRNPVITSSLPVNESVMAISEGDWLLSIQLQDPKICAIRDILESGEKYFAIMSYLEIRYTAELNMVGGG